MFPWRSKHLQLQTLETTKRWNCIFLWLECHLWLCRYTREAGVRSLERKIGAICRAVAVKVAEGHRLPETDASSLETSPQQEGERQQTPQRFDQSWVQWALERRSDKETRTSTPHCVDTLMSGTLVQVFNLIIEAKQLVSWVAACF